MKTCSVRNVPIERRQHDDADWSCSIQEQYQVFKSGTQYACEMVNSARKHCRSMISLPSYEFVKH